MTGNGDFNQRDQLGTSFVKVSPDLRILSWFTPANYRKLNLLDLDLGSAGPVLLPDTGELVGGGKEGRLFLLKQSALGGLERHTFWHAQNNPPVQSFRGTPGWRLTWTSWIPGLWNEGVSPLARLSGLLAEPERSAPLHLGGTRQPPQLFLRPGDTLQPQSREKQGPSA